MKRLVAALLWVGCAQSPGVTVDISTALPMQGARRVEIAATLGDKHERLLIIAPGGDVTFPTQAHLIIRRGEGHLVLTAITRDGDGRELGRGSSEGEFIAGQSSLIRVMLEAATPPPADACIDANTRRRYDPAAHCQNGQCSYRYTDSVCQNGCQDGTCVGEDPCNDILCSRPPSPSCRDQNTLQRSAQSGTCTNGTCMYELTLFACEAACFEGQCNGDPCAGVACDNPPVATCLSDNMLRTYNSSGTCGDGKCSYAPNEVFCPNGCDQGRCLNDPCLGVSCNAPPSNQCMDSMTLRTFNQAGTCTDGVCMYVSATLPCEYGCANGSCNNNPCAGVTCSSPTANTCVDGNNLRVFTSPGTCNGGACSYSSAVIPCQHGCENGICKNDPCVGVTCNAPPANTCSGDMLVTYSMTGTCAGGACSYASVSFICPLGCANGRCNSDPCVGVSCNSPPSTSCVNGNTLRTYPNAGTCNSNGSCSYSPADVTCQFGCEAGLCKNDPCAGVICNALPASFCLSPINLQTYGTAGTCSNGACSYAPTIIFCEYECKDGACINDPCAGVTCNSPPAANCADPSTLRTYGSGACSDGACSYVATNINCQYGCSNGACSGNPCAGVTCSAPPANTCADANNLRVYSSPGTCGGGSCTYNFGLVSCQYGCESGSCKNDPCAGVMCNTPPANGCFDGNTARIYAATGTCSAGACTYTPTLADCGGACEGGTCQLPRSCHALKQHQPGITANGAYQMDPDGPGPLPPYWTYCDMSTDGGGWTLVAQVNGNTQTWAYDAALWTDTNLLNNNNSGAAGSESAFNRQVEAKLQSFTTVPFTQVRLGMWDPTDGGTRWVTINQTASSMRALMASNPQATNIGRAAWTGLLSAPALQVNCNREAFNTRSNSDGAMVQRVRLGFLANDNNDCQEPHSFIGVGAKYSSNQTTRTSCGNFAAGNGSPSRDVRAWGYIMVRDGTTCSNAMKDVSEPEKDCGAACQTKCTQYCSQDGDCATGVCAGGTCAAPKFSCKAIKDSPSTAASGVYRIDTDGAGVTPPLEVYCDMETDGGGWTFFSHVDDSADVDATGRLWEVNVGNYRADRADDETTYSLGLTVIQNLKTVSTEMMVTLDNANFIPFSTPSVDQADAQNTLVFYKFNAGHSAFTAGPAPCSGLTGYQYRVNKTGPYLSGGSNQQCNGNKWYASVSGGNGLVSFDATMSSGNNWGQSMGGDGSWVHDGWWYVR